MSLIASTPQTSVLEDITASVDNVEPTDITDEPESSLSRVMTGW